jgi:hypothetical protein
MKARPRAVEREAAACLSDILSPLGLTPIKRVPVIGRTGPDLTINESLLAIDVKSRCELPKYFWTPRQTRRQKFVLRYTDGVLGVHLGQLELLLAETPVSEDTLPLPPDARRYLEHMAEWTERPVDAARFLATERAFSHFYLPAVVCHRSRPRQRIANAIFLIYEKDLCVLRQTLKELT